MAANFAKLAGTVAAGRVKLLIRRQRGNPTPAGKHSVLKTERSLKERQCGDQPSREHQGHSPVDKVPGHFPFTPFFSRGCQGYIGRSASKSYDDLALGLMPLKQLTLKPTVGKSNNSAHFHGTHVPVEEPSTA